MSSKQVWLDVNKRAVLTFPANPKKRKWRVGVGKDRNQLSKFFLSTKNSKEISRGKPFAVLNIKIKLKFIYKNEQNGKTCYSLKILYS